MLQGKTVIQAEIDAAAELIDFFRFNAQFAVELEGEQPISLPPSTNRVVYRGLEVLWAEGGVRWGQLGAWAWPHHLHLPQGFVAAISPFNFTAIGGNLSGVPALMVRTARQPARSLSCAWSWQRLAGLIMEAWGVDSFWGLVFGLNLSFVPCCMTLGRVLEDSVSLSAKWEQQGVHVTRLAESS